MNEALAIAAKAKICSVKLGAVETARFSHRIAITSNRDLDFQSSAANR
jgi:predicted solute-binding protein